MRILHLTTGLGRGGSEAMLIKVVDQLKNLGCDQRVVSLSASGERADEIRALGIPVIEMHWPQKLLSLNPFQELKESQQMQNFRPDFIQGWMYHGNLVAVLLKFLFFSRSLVVWNIRQSLATLLQAKWLTYVVIRIGPIFERFARLTLYNSKVAHLDHISIGYSAEKSRIIPNGFDLVRFRPNNTSRRKMREDWCVSEAERLVGWIGRDHLDKNLDGFISVMSKVIENHQNVYAIIVGHGTDQERYKKQVSSSIGSRFIFMGARSDISDILCGLDVYCSTSRAEAFSNALGEAMAVGLPCVVTDVGDAKDILESSDYVVAPLDLELMTKKVSELLEQEGGKLELLGRQNRMILEAKYSIEAVGKQYFATYRDLMG